ncbi:MAG: nucleotidyltransferase domain-containing protein [Magnetococcales bacterium]|nr:nucleotidyltransferase domain-containing protein [Magnetococcales bacterium]
MSLLLDIAPQEAALLHGLLQRYLPDVSVWAYGSRVKGSARRYSDLDLVVFATPEQRDRVVEFREAADESNLPFLLDVLIWEQLPEAFHRTIEARHVMIQDAKGGGPNDPHAPLAS